jgi:putative alpha-1,2-mannosidase
MGILCGTILAAVLPMAALPAMSSTAGAGSLECVDPLIGTEGKGTQYGGMQPYTCVPFGSFHLVPMTRTNDIGRLNSLLTPLACLAWQKTAWP